jgi:ankyrin repeat protein
MHYRQDEVQDARADSCGWVLAHGAYQSWIDNPHGLLWVKGKPGSGKSTLMKRIFKEDATQADVHLSFFFHRRGAQLQQTFTGMLRTMSHQLIIQCAPAREIFRTRYNDKKVFGRYGEDWDWRDPELRQALKSALLVAIQSHAISIFIDALDEASGSSAESIVTYIYELHEEFQSSAGQTRICFSCRHYPIHSRSKGFEVCMEKQNEADISSCVRRELSERIQKNRRLSWADDLKVLQNQIANSADGVFLWASLMVSLVAKEYNKGRSLKDVLKMLQKAPPDLDSIYKYILTTLIDVEDRKDSIHLMQWISLAKRPLSVTEVRYALALDDSVIHEVYDFVQESEGFVKDDSQMKQLITSLSGGLAEVKEHRDSNVVQFIHQSVNDSLLRGGFEWLGMQSLQDVVGQGHHRLTRSCVNYLKLGEVQEVELPTPYDGRQTQIPPFLEYATKFWFLHAQEAESKYIAQNDLIQRFEWPDRRYFYRWIDIYRAINGGARECPEVLTTLLHTSAASNLQSIVQELIVSRSFLEEEDVQGNRALHFAARFGHEKIVEILLDAKADLQAQNAVGNTALERAASGGHINTIKLLIDSGAAVNFSTGNSENALYSAVFSGSYLATRLLLDHGADVNAQGGEFGNALQAATCVESEPIVKLLLDHGADVNAQGGEYDNALQAATCVESEPIVKLLLDHGADVHAQGGEFGNALQAAVYIGSEPVVKLFLDHGADIHAQGGRYGNALQAAAYKGSEPVVKLLLDHGADVYAQGGKYSNALQAAAYIGSEPVVKLLLDHGADVICQDNQGRYPIHLAIRGNHEKVIDLFLAKTRTLNWSYQDQQGCSALHFAASGGSEWAIQMILKSDIDINLPDTRGWTPLHWACRSGDRKIVQMLRDSGADWSSKDIKGWTPFDVAIFCGNSSVVGLPQDETKQAEPKQLVTKPGKRQSYICSSCYHVSHASSDGV